MDEESHICKFCNKVCKNNNSLAQHQIRCSKNPDRINTVREGFNNKGKSAWNKGTKGLITFCPETRKKMSDSARKANERRKLSDEYEEYKQKMSVLAKDRGLGGFHFRRGVYYNGVKLDSSYEVRVAEDLDRNNVAWKRCDKFYYVDDKGITHSYTPDFYLPEYNVYLDPKNDYLIEKGQPGSDYSDKQKIDWVCQQNNIKVFILNKNELQWSVIKNMIDKLAQLSDITTDL